MPEPTERSQADLRRVVLQRLRLAHASGITHLLCRRDASAAVVASDAGALGTAGANDRDESHGPNHSAPAPAPSPVADVPVRERGPDPGPTVDRGDESEVGAQLDEMARQVAACTRCAALVEHRNKTVFADGTPHTPLMFVGEAPGQDEDRAGIPFVGRAGQKLTEIIERGLAAALVQSAKRAGQSLDIGFVPRSSVYIANVLKCRPPGNRNPQPDEVANCSGFLAAQIALVRPKVIVALGRPAANRLLGNDDPIGSLRGRLHALPDHPEIVVVAAYHPAFLLRSYTKENRMKMMEDLVLAAGALIEHASVPWW